MAIWKVAPESVDNTMAGGINYDQHGAQWTIQQNIDPYLAQAEADRKMGDGKKHYTKMYSIPDIIAIEIKQKYGIDVFNPNFMHDKDQKSKVHVIIQTEYPHLMSTDKRV